MTEDRVETTQAEVLALAREMRATATKLAAEVAARNRAQEVRAVARTLERCAATIDRVQLHGADELRAAATRFAGVADTLEAMQRTR